MTVQALPGNVRHRAFQLGLQTTFGTPVIASRRMPWRYNPTLDPHWTSPDVDTGTLDPAIAPYRMATDITGQATGPLASNDAPILWALLLKGGETPTGPTDSAYTWDFDPASTTSDPFEIVSGEWGDEVVADQFQYSDGVIDQATLTFPQDLGPIQVSADFRWGSFAYPTTRQALTVDTSPEWLYAADTRLYINDTAGSIGVTPLVNSMHDASIQIQTNLDVKRFANGSNSNFAVAGYGRGARLVTTTINFAKSTQALAEVALWLNANPQERFLQMDTTSRSLIGVSTYHSQRIRLAGHWFTRSEGAVNSNTTAQLVCQHIVDTGLASAFSVRNINTQATLLAP